MSIFIRGITVKRGRCVDWPCYDHEYGECNVLQKDIFDIGDKCPIIEIPENGDLIELNVLNVTDSWERITEWARHAKPVVIQAERIE